MATTGLKWLQEKPFIPMDPDTIVQFYIQGRTITRDFKRTLCKMIQPAPLRNFYYNRFYWSDNIFDAVDWDIFRPAYRKHIASTGIQWLHKYCIKKLPTRGRNQPEEEYTNEIIFTTRDVLRASRRQQPHHSMQQKILTLWTQHLLVNLIIIYFFQQQSWSSFVVYRCLIIYCR